MAFKTFAPGVLTSSDVNTFLMRQAVITCTSSTRPASPNEGMTIYETDTDLYQTWSGSAWTPLISSGTWQSWTPTISSYGAGTDWALGNATVAGGFLRVGKGVIGWQEITFGSTSTFGTKFLAARTPTTQKNYGISNTPIGVPSVFDVSIGTRYAGVALAVSNTTQTSLFVTAASGTYATWAGITSTVPFTWAAGDQIHTHFYYEEA